MDRRSGLDWRCPECHDTMHPKFQASHTRICPIIKKMIWHALDL